MAGLLSAPVAKKRPLRPKNAVPPPNMSPKPSARNAREETANTTKFLKRMLTQFLARQKPDSTSPKPRFMKKTRNAASITQMVSMAIFWLAMASAISFVKAGAGVAGAAWAGADAGAAAAGAAGGGR